jgi:hypothetical protein
MRNITLSLLCAAAISSSLSANNFAGFYAGGELGATQQVTDNQLYQDKTGASASINQTIRSRNNGINYGLYGGYGSLVSSFYLGGEAYLQDDNINKTNNNTYDGSWPNSSKYERGTVLGVGPRLGKLFGESSMLYTRLGLEISRDKTQTQVQPSNGFGQSAVYSSGTKTKYMFVPAVGFEHYLSQKVLGRVEYGYNFGAKINQKTNYTSNGVTFSNNQNSQYAAHVVKCGVAYQF